MYKVFHSHAIEWLYLFSMIAVIGLIENSSVILVASMLISPLMVRDVFVFMTHFCDQCIFC